MENKKTWIQNNDGSWDLVSLEVFGYEDGIIQFGKEISREYVGFFQGAMPNPEDFYTDDDNGSKSNNVNNNNNNNNTDINQRLLILENSVNKILTTMEAIMDGKKRSNL